MTAIAPRETTAAWSPASAPSHPASGYVSSQALWAKSGGADTSSSVYAAAKNNGFDAPLLALGGDYGADDGDILGILCSFAPATLVLMAHGKTKAIGKIKAGDQVEAADPHTGKHRGPRVVLARVVHHDNDLIDLSIETASHHSAVVHTTSRHPFWDDTDHTWVSASRLKPGHDLRTASNGRVRILAVRVRPGAADMYNFTVQQLHTYYVLAGETPVLVHNCNTEIKNVALGASGNGLEKFAKDNKHTHFMGETQEGALANVRDVANEHPEAHIHVRLDGFKMTNGRPGTPAELFDDAVKEGQGNNWYTTQREMAILERVVRVGNLGRDRLSFYMGGKDITSEVFSGSQYLGGS